jgi:O-antigen ligase
MTVPNLTKHGAPGWAKRLPFDKLARGLAYVFLGTLAFGTAPVNLSKTLLLMVLPIALAIHWWLKREPSSHLRDSQALHWVALLSVGVLALSGAWSSADSETVLSAWVKSSKVLVPCILILVLTSRRSAKTALAWFVCWQAVLLLLTAYIAIEGRPHWLGTTNRSNIETNAPSHFTSYLGMGVSCALASALCWHWRKAWGNPFAEAGMIAVALGNAVICLYIPGRTGHLMLVLVTGVSIWLAVPRRYKFLALALPPLLLALLFAVSPRSLDRAKLAVTQAQSFQKSGEVMTSIGERLHYWTLASEMIAERPLLGHGIGSWQTEYAGQIKGRAAPPHGLVVRNPHQEFLLWGVHLGVTGLLLIAAWFLSAAWVARRFSAHGRAAVWSLLAGIALAACFNSVLFDAHVGDVVTAMLGLALALGLTENAPEAELQTRGT